MSDQMSALDQSGLLAEVDEFYIGVNGDQDYVDMARLFVTCPNAQFFVHGAGSTTEIPTLSRLRFWLLSHPDWYVLYHHIKGATNPRGKLWINWRNCMEAACVWNWRQCLDDLDKGADAVGCHWLTPEKHGHLIKSPFFGGNFWWAKASYLLTLPLLPEATWANRFEAESWIGYGPKLPKVIDYHPVSKWNPGTWKCRT